MVIKNQRCTYLKGEENYKRAKWSVAQGQMHNDTVYPQPKGYQDQDGSAHDKIIHLCW